MLDRPKSMKNSYCISLSALAIGAFSALVAVQSSFATESFYYSDVNGPADGNWATYLEWSVNASGSGGTLSAAAAGGIYTIVTNTVVLNGGGTYAYIRTPNPSGSNSVTFPGDSLVVGLGTELRLISAASSGVAQGGTAGTSSTATCFYSLPTNNFPGNNGNAGLVLNGGALDPAQGTAARCFVIGGTISNVPGVTSYIFPGGYVPGAGPGGQASVIVAVNIAGQLSGGGTLAVLSGTNNLPGVQITGLSNTYAGGWLLQAGWLQGAGDGTNDGYNALGTNSTSSIVVNPLYQVATTAGSGFSASNAVGFWTNTVLDLGAATMNSAGTLTLTNGGQMWLHGQYIFSAVSINGVNLSATGGNGSGYYSYTTLTNMFPGYVTGLPAIFNTFGGGITVRPYNATLPSYPPLISPEPPASILAYAGGSTNIVSGAVSQTTSTNVSLQWYTVSGSGLFTQVANAGDITGATNSTLSFSDLALSDATNYALVASNSGGASTSTVVALTVSTSVAISVQPISESLFTGGTAKFVSGAIGAGTITFQWYTVDNTLTNFTGDVTAANSSGATTSTLTITPLSTSNATNYVMVASNNYGATATSSVVSLAVTVGPANEVNYYCNTNDSVNPASWTAATVGWTTNNYSGLATSSGPYFAPAPGGVYNVVWNGTQMNGGGTYAYIRSPQTATNAVFPGDSLVINPGAMLRIKDVGASATDFQSIPAGTTGVSVLANANPTNVFPGSNGFAGLVLNGGVLDGAQGDPNINDVILGTIEAAPGTLSYLFSGGYVPGGGSQDSVLHAFTLAGQLSGSGTLAEVSATNNVPGLQITGTSNNFTGAWILQGGWLQGVGDGSNDGYNSLGTNVTCSITVDPLYQVSTNAGDTGFLSPNATGLWTNALLDLGPGIMNSAGTLTLTNGGQMWMHGHYIFSAVTIDGTSLADGLYSYSTLAGDFPGNFTGLPAVFTSFGGDITVRSYGGRLPPYSPLITGPANEADFVGGTVQFVTSVSGVLPINYQWYTVDSTGTIFTPLNNGGEIAGATNTTLTLTGITMGDATNYAMIATNNLGGAATSSVVSLTVYIDPPSSTFTLNYASGGSGGIGLMPAGASWNTPGYWWDGNVDGGLPALTLAADLPSVPFVVPAGSTLNTIATANNSSVTFPGAVLELQGDGNFNSSDESGNTGVVLYKGGNIGTLPTYTGVVDFPNLMIGGGQVDVGNPGTCILDGMITIAPPNAIFYEDSGATDDRGFTINSLLTGSGNIEIELDSYYAGFQTTFSNNVNITGTANTYDGTWYVGEGSLLGSGNDSLGTNSITVGPNGALETLYNIIDPNASLTLNGQMFLHENDIFSNVTVGGFLLPQGTYTYAELETYGAAYFPATWNQLNGSTVAAASGSIQVLSTNGNAPSIGTQPQSMSRYVGATATFSVISSGQPPLSYQWAAGTTGSGGPYSNILGATNSTLKLADLTTNEALDYVVVISNSFSVVTSSPATLTVVVPTCAYAASVIDLTASNLVAYWRFNETSGTTAYDYWGGFNGVYGAELENGAQGINGPLPPPFPGFESTNYAMYPFFDQANSYVTVPALNVNTNALTIIAWINPSGGIADAAGIFFCRAGTTVAGMNYTPSANALGYTWANNGATYEWNSGILPPVGQWSMSALVVTPTNASIYLLNANGLQSSNNPVANVVQNFDGISLIGDDSYDNNAGTRTFNGIIDEVSVFNTSLSLGQITALYNQASQVILEYTYSAGVLQLTWSQGTLLQATNLLGPWSTNSAAVSPYTTNVLHGGPQMYFKVLVGP
jgi:hypothetical protein